MWCFQRIAFSIATPPSIQTGVLTQSPGTSRLAPMRFLNPKFHLSRQGLLRWVDWLCQISAPPLITMSLRRLPVLLWHSALWLPLLVRQAVVLKLFCQLVRRTNSHHGSHPASFLMNEDPYNWFPGFYYEFFCD